MVNHAVLVDEPQETTASYSLITPSLVLSMVLSGFPVMLLSLFITDMAQMFGVEVGVMGIVRSASEIGSVVMGVLLGALSVRYRQKSLLLLGIGIICVATLTLGIILMFPLFLVSFALLGVSRVTVRSMSHALVGQLFTTKQRPTIQGYMVIGETGAYLIGSTLSVFVPSFQAISLFFLFPLSATVILLIAKSMPSTPLVKRNPLTAFREVLRNRSAAMILLSHGLSIVSTNHCYLTFFMPLYLLKFLADRTFVTMVFSLGCVLIAATGMVSGRVINTFGRKSIVVISSLLISVFCALMMLSPIFELSLLSWVIAGVNVGLYLASSNNFALEQLPEFRGTMMSLNLTAQFIAQAIGSAVGGILLMTYGFDALGVFSLIGIGASVLFYVFTIDPTQVKSHP
jgi:predicted MFS family arabinose efflux permease